MYEMLVIGFSAGGIPLMNRILKALPDDYPLPIAVATHSPHAHQSALAEIFECHTRLRVGMVKDKEPVQPGKVYIAPPDYHLLLERTASPTPAFALSVDEPVGLVRPSIDVLLKSAAEIFETRLIAVLLSGANADGAQGMAHVKQLGGLCIVLDPQEAEFNALPNAALKQTSVDYVSGMQEIITLLCSAHEPS